MRQYNDYELIHLYKTENCEIALNVLIKKYTNMIHKFNHQYFVSNRFYDDYLQEGLMMLLKAIDSFDDSFNKTFTRYYELILRRRIIYLKNKEPKYELHEDFHVYQDHKNYHNNDFEIEGLTDLEKNVFKRYYVYNQEISFIAKNEKKSKKQIYNAIYRIKNKYKNNML